MRSFATRPALRWLVPLGVVCAIALIAAMTAVIRSGASASLPPRTAAQLLVALSSADTTGVSGTVVERADLGLPALPNNIGGDGTADWSLLLSGSHTLRVWSAGPTMSRVALLGALGESDVVRNGPDLWIWSSADNEAQHLRLPSGPAQPGVPNGGPMPYPSLLPTSPEQAATALLGLLDKTTSIRNAGAVTVAGRPAYELVIAPRDSRSLVASIRIAIDSAKSVPLRLRVFARGHASPAFEVGFTQVSFDRPDATLFHFDPPAGAKVTEIRPSAGHAATAPDTTAPSKQPPTNAKPGPAERPQATVIGTGWTAILAARLPGTVTTSSGATSSGGSAAPPDIRGTRPGNPLGAIIGALPRVSGTWGSGRMLSTRLLSVLVTDDGRVFAGAVAPSALLSAASSSAGQLTAPSPHAAPPMPAAPPTPAPAPASPSPAHT
ncbi:MAG TPA: hypothetical protein VKB59_08970 [Micromonosporaceae bacterium]|nr:hypothetical protein [Micromonosporaceae bacterium]